MCLFHLSPMAGRNTLLKLLDRVPKEFLWLYAECSPKFFCEPKVYFCLHFDDKKVGIVVLGLHKNIVVTHYHVWQGTREAFEEILRSFQEGSRIHWRLQIWMEELNPPEVINLEEALDRIGFKPKERVLKLICPKQIPSGKPRKRRYRPERDTNQRNFFNLTDPPE